MRRVGSAAPVVSERPAVAAGTGEAIVETSQSVRKAQTVGLQNPSSSWFIDMALGPPRAKTEAEALFVSFGDR